MSDMLEEGPTLALRADKELRAFSFYPTAVNINGREGEGKALFSLRFPYGKREVCIKLKEVIFAAIRQRVPSVRESIKN
jgi:archaellum biogenesis ATPase FlaH